MTNNTSLSPRLMSVCSFVPKGSRLADIGTDHARVPIYLIKNGIIISAIASDIGEGPLEKAAENLEFYNLSGMVDLRLGDGLKTIKGNEADCAVIAGMGGELISNILHAYIPDGLKRLIFQPMTDPHLVRRAAGRLGFKITAEDIVPENDKMYIILCCEPGEMTLSADEEYLSPMLKAHPLYGEYLSFRLTRLEKAAVQAEKAGAETDMVKEYRLLKKAYEEIKDVL